MQESTIKRKANNKKGILWAHNDDPRLKAAIMQSREW